MTEIRQRHG